MSDEYYAHTPPDDEPTKWQTMEAHTNTVAELAESFATAFGAEGPARWAGILHDVGKYSPEFQAYLRACHSASVSGTPTPKPGSAEHKCAGTQAAIEYLPKGLWEAVAVCVLGHHGGLNRATDTKAKVAEQAAKQDLKGVIATAKQERADLTLTPSPDVRAFDLIPKKDPERSVAFEMLTRLVFSCLVDADSLDTEAHFNPKNTGLRVTAKLSEVARDWLDDLNNVVTLKQSAGTDGAADQTVTELRVKRVRHEVYAACIEAGKKAPGVFALTVPTGGGKTLASLAFALSHAIAHESSEQDRRSRIIYAIPFTSIIDQTAQVFREVVGDDGVLEHHSAVEPRFLKQDEAIAAQQGEASRELQRRLAAENWQHPLIVTTTVQLFESLFSNLTSRCRKLHNIARSVLILDEVQTLPPHLLTPLVDGLRALSEQFGVTVVLCTATQPAVEGNTPYLRGLPEVTQIIDNPGPHFRDLRRVTYKVAEEKWSWVRLAEDMCRRRSSCVAVVNSKNDALALYNSLKGADGTEVIYLSTLLCGAHRRKIIEDIKTGLNDARQGHSPPILLVSTQLIEAGVDLDFPYAYRAQGPLDRIVQAAGRCNREGRRPFSESEVVVFVPEDGKAPPGDYATAMKQAWNMISDISKPFDFDSPAAVTDYFRRFYSLLSAEGLDKRKVQEDRQNMRFPEVAEKVRLIDQDTIPVLVSYGDTALFDGFVEEIRDRARRKLGMTRDLWRRIQPLTVAMYPKDREVGTRVEKTIEDQIWIWFAKYDMKTGCAEFTVDTIA